MNDFKTRKIRYKERSFWHKISKFISRLKPKKSINKIRNSRHKTHIGIIGAIIVVFVLFIYGCGAVISKIGVINVIGFFGEPLITDSYGNTNILLLGTGGEGHDGADLTDTIILMSIDQKNNVVPMLSIPRDFYVKTEELGEGSRINSVYELGKDKYNSQKGMELAIQAIEDISGVEVHYYVKIDFKGFKDIVDSLGGVEVNVDQPINDPYYPKDGTIKYEPFYLEAGLQEMDGETALKYARSRKTTSDFDRSKRQQKLLFAIKNKAMSKNVLMNPGKIKDLYSAVSAHIETNLSIRHIIELAKISKDFGQENIITRVIVDDPTQCGGFVYTPERKFFDGAFVLVPIGNHYDFIHQYVDLIFHYPEIHTDPVQIQVLNGTKTAGIAAETKALLNRLCFDVIRFGNARSQDIETTTLYYKDKSQPEEEPQMPPVALNFISELIPGVISQDIPDKYFEPQYISDADIIIEIGEDYAKSRPEDIFYLYYPQATPNNDDDEESEGEESAEAEAAPATETAEATE